MSDPRIPPRETCVLRYQLLDWAERQPDKTFAVFESGESWTYAQTQAQAQTLAGALQAVGVQQGDTVISWLPNGSEAFQVWFGCNWMGAVYVPLNTAYRGSLLQHVVTNANARVMICHRALVDRLDDIDLGTVDTVIVVGEQADSSYARFEDFLAAAVTPELPRPVEPWDIQYIIFTSGTTGPFKGILIPYLQTYFTGAFSYGKMLDAQDRYIGQPTAISRRWNRVVCMHVCWLMAVPLRWSSTFVPMCSGSRFEN
jgi:crotonobetaine/carnitine-CoA ligase